VPAPKNAPAPKNTCWHQTSGKITPVPTNTVERAKVAVAVTLVVVVAGVAVAVVVFSSRLTC
jgi:hypothetical protein